MAVRPPTAEDQQLALAASRKRQANQEPTRSESAALARVQRYREEQERWKHYAAVPKTHYCRLASRQQKVIDEQAVRYGLPIGGDSINLSEVLTAFHDLLKERGAALLNNEEDGGLPTPALEKLREEKYRLARLQRLERERELLPRELVHGTLSQIAQQLRQFGESLQRQYGNDAADLLNNFLDGIQKQVSQLIESHADHTSTADDPDDAGGIQPPV